VKAWRVSGIGGQEERHVCKTACKTRCKTVRHVARQCLTCK
jgi:hypothetical protein